MHATDWAVLLGALAAIAWVNWYFFLAERGSVSMASNGGAPTASHGATLDRGVRSVTIVVQGGYERSTIRVRAGEPVRLVFDRRETSSCSEEVVFPDFGSRTFLPAHERTAVVVTPPAAGRYEFTCGMSMLRGRLVAE